MSYFDFDQEATVSIQEKLLLGGIGGGIGQTHPFPTLHEALAFIASLTPEQRAHAWVMTEGHTYHGEDVDDLIRKRAAQTAPA